MEEATIRARLEGDRWIVRNSELLQSLTIPWTMSRWDDWRFDPRYVPSRERIQFLYDNHEELRQAVALDADRFLRSYLRRGNTLADPAFAERKCIDFLLEENAVLPLLNEDHGGVDLGLGDELNSTTSISTHKIPGVPAILHKWKTARILFRKIKGDSAEVQADKPPHLAVSNG